MTLHDPEYSLRCLKSEQERLGHPSEDHESSPDERVFQDWLYSADLPYTTPTDRRFLRLGFMAGRASK